MNDAEWIRANVVNQNYIVSDKLNDKQTEILITYETLKKRRYVKQVLCNHGRVDKKINGEILAWTLLPEPYNGD